MKISVDESFLFVHNTDMQAKHAKQKSNVKLQNKCLQRVSFAV
jgi:hypothetical protein